MQFDPNLTLTGYGVTLRRVTHDKIEMLRQWRNDPKIQQYMFSQNYITQEMQEAWFKRINNDNNLHFIIEFENKEIGSINIQHVDYINKNGEPGVYIYDDEYLNSDIAYRAHLVLFDYIYETMHLDFTYSNIQKDNIRAIRFAKFLGSKEISTETNEIRRLVLTKEDYYGNPNRTHFLKRWNHFNK